MANDFELSKYYDLLEKGYDSEEIINYFISQNIKLVGWFDHLAEFADVRVEKELGADENGDPILQHKRFDGAVFQEGTPVNAENMGQMEWNDLINALKIQSLMDTVRTLQIQVATLIGQNNNNMPYNSFVASAKNIDTDIMIIEGYYDEVNGRGVV
jgi:hypothetical protein